MSFMPRMTAPSATDTLWRHTSAGGKNSCILISGGSVLPNCVGYAWGRFMEILGSTPKLSRGNAENWYGMTSDGYKRSQASQLGAVVCWSKGKVGVASDGAGHVAIVEKIAPDGTITTSNSGYNGTRFYIKEIKPPYAVSGYDFQGFILNPAVDAVSAPPVPLTPPAAYPYPVPVRTLKRGDRGEDVKWLQWQINSGGGGLVVDGSFGPATDAAVRLYQSQMGLAVDGLVGPKTRDMLMRG